MEKDSGKIRVEVREGIPVVEVYHNGELTLTDILWIKHTLLNEMDPPLKLPVDFIIDRVGSYSLSEDAYINMQQIVSEGNRIAFVTHSPTQEVVTDLAANSYLREKMVKKFPSVDEALNWIKEDKAQGSD